MYGPSILSGAGFPSSNGWYATVASPHMMDAKELEPWVKRFTAKFNSQPSDYSITAYDAALVVLDSIERVAKTGKPVTRAAVRDAIQASKVKTLQGTVSFDDNGDLTNRIVSIFQVQYNSKFPNDDIVHQYKYIGAAPQDTV
jgi:branched-chain amino acid transport system substrate-binding protein